MRKRGPVSAMWSLGRIGRSIRDFLMWWASPFLLGATSTCPCCGQPSCAGGIASAGLLGAVAAAMLTLPKWIRARLRSRGETA